MNNRLQQQQSVEAGLEQQTGTAQKKSFDSAEEVIAADRAQTAVPGSLGGRLAESISGDTASPPPPRPWWRRLFGG